MVLVKNTGTSPAAISSVALSGTNAAEFGMTHNCPSALAVNSTCSVTLTAKPTNTGSNTATLTVASNATNPSATLNLTATGVAPAVAIRNTANTANVTSLAFADQLVGTTSAAQQFRVYNTGTAPATSFSVTEAGTNPGHYVTSSDCGTSLVDGGFCTVTVSFKPTVKSANLTMTVNVNSSAGLKQVTASGEAIQGTVQVTVDGVVNPTSVNFGTVAVN